MNDRREAVVQPGTYLTVDESMCQWEGANGRFNHEGMPHVTKIKSKPKPIGAELKTCCDGSTGIMMRVEIQEGKEAMKTKEFSELYPAGTATTLRLVKPWLGEGRVVVGDSAFASIPTAVALMEQNTDFIGIVKTAHSGFPRDHFIRWSQSKPARGSINVRLKRFNLKAGPARKRSRQIMAIG